MPCRRFGVSSTIALRKDEPRGGTVEEAGGIAASTAPAAADALRYADVNDTMVALSAGPYLVVAHRDEMQSVVGCWKLESEIVGANASRGGIALHPEGKQVAAVVAKPGTTYPGVSVVVLQLPSGQRLFQAGPWSVRCFGVNFSPDGRLVLCHGDFGLEVWDSGTGLQTATFDHNVQVVAVACHFSAAGRFLATAGGFKGVKVRDLAQDGVEMARYTEPTTTLGVAFDESGERIAYST
eukprot:SAG31_NODE_13196_length_886_cov_1.409149_1_plen_237_part_10